MAFEYQHNGTTWVLHSKFVDLKGGNGRVFYFFCKKGREPNSGKPAEALPVGKAIGVNVATGMPFLRNE